jgi:uncharacterized protein (TIGR03435 family)
MKRLFVVVAVIAVFSGSVLGQAPASRPAFEVAGIHVSTRPQPGMRGGQLRGNRYEIRNATMVDLIRTAFNVQPEKISGGPTWLEWNRFDIAALAPEKTPPDRLREMLKTLLAERFKLVVREDSVNTTAMALKVKGTHKLKESSAPGGGCNGQGAPEPNGVTAITATCNMTMAQFVEQLPQAQSAYFPNGQKLIDETGLSGSWEFQIKFTPRPLLGQAGSDGVTLQAALEKVGLFMEPRDIKVPAIVVETVTAEFTPNPGDLAKRLPPAPAPQFEVAVLKPTPPDATQTRAQLRPTGQVDISAAPLNRIIGLAWNLTDGGQRVGDDAYLVGPKWLETARFDVTARAFADTNPANNAGADEDLARLMLRSLLIEKFQIKWHMEDRPMPAFAIVADSPKMTKGDPTKRTRCFEGLPPGSPAAAKPPQFPRLVTCENVSMTQFGQLLPQIASGYTRVNALDKTGLQGGFDFTLNFSPIGQVQGPQPEAGATITGAALDPTGALSLQDAVRRQLGIRLEDTKLPVPVLVIDSISQTPLDN